MYQVLPQFISSLLEYFTLWPSSSSSWFWPPPSSCSAQLVAWRRDNGTDRAYSAFHHRIPSLQWLVKAQAGNIIFITITVITINLLHHLQRHHQQQKPSTIKRDTTSAKCLGHGVSWLPPLRHTASFPGGFFLLPDDLKTIFYSCFTFPQVTLLFKHWNEFGDVIIEYGTMKSPQCKHVFLCLSKRSLIYEHKYIYLYMYFYIKMCVPQIPSWWFLAFFPPWSSQSRLVSAISSARWLKSIPLPQ